MSQPSEQVIHIPLAETNSVYNIGGYSIECASKEYFRRAPRVYVGQGRFSEARAQFLFFPNMQ